MTSGKRPRVLVADDEELVRRSVGRALSLAGLDVVLARDGSEALGMLLDDRFDVLLSDVQMPGGGGMELLRAVRRAGGRLPVILMTGAPNAKMAAEAAGLGATDYLSKPISATTVVDRVRSAAASRSWSDEP